MVSLVSAIKAPGHECRLPVGSPTSFRAPVAVNELPTSVHNRENLQVMPHEAFWKEHYGKLC